jgi:hypothetical protein
MEIGNTAVQTLMALDLAVAEFRRRVAEHVFMHSAQLSPLCHHPMDLHRFMEQFAQLMAQPLGVILVEGDPDRARATVESFLENARLLLHLEISSGAPPAG